LKLLKQKHLSMPCLNTSVTLMTTGIVKWTAMVEEAQRCSRLASRTGTKFLRVFGGGIPTGMQRETARKIVSEHLAELIAVCDPNGCKPLLETHDDWTLGDELLQIISSFDASEAGVLWDLEHPWRNSESPMETATKLAHRIEHVHIKDTVRREGKSIPMLLGEGEVPIAECMDALASIGYTGWICLETEKRWHPEGPSPEQSVPQFAEYMRARQ
jgi:sugar phosphate isomerase/epimerase